tara:strand:+ start:259 stop:672 length:414 start_codon:yes stop_codon:yes gene_type:complete
MKFKYLKQYENFQDGEKIYHVAPVSKRESILENGLIAESDKRYSGISEDSVYVWEHLKMAMWYSLTEARDNSMSFDVYEIDYSGNMTEDDSMGVPFAFKVESISPDSIKLIDTVEPNDDRLSQYSDVDEIIEDIEWS